MIDQYRRRPGLLLGSALAVFVPLNVVRYVAIDAGWFPVAIALTFAGHLALVPILGRRVDPGPVRPAVAAAGVVAITALEVVGGLAVEAIVGRSTFGIMFGGFVPSVLLAPAWALLVVGALAARRADRTVVR